MGSRTWQRTTNFDARSSKAVDGHASVHFDPTTCSQSELPYQSWWTVDLGRERTIFEVTILRPEDCCGKYGYAIYDLVDHCAIVLQIFGLINNTHINILFLFMILIF